MPTRHRFLLLLALVALTASPATARRAATPAPRRTSPLASYGGVGGLAGGWSLKAAKEEEPGGSATARPPPPGHAPTPLLAPPTDADLEATAAAWHKAGYDGEGAEGASDPTSASPRAAGALSLARLAPPPDGWERVTLGGREL